MGIDGRIPNFVVCEQQMHRSVSASAQSDQCLYYSVSQGSRRLEKYLNLEEFLEKSLKIKSALKSTGKSLKSLENP